ncbi:hypothetical protein SAMN05660284_02390 [Formivibrio citricus]|uniref:Uncharacterized protein n=1 Tax=Formivibrio citricus TaxID=83765 RepID=A0A1I5CDS3_9NEIS|nr:hypothetical protein [Formivibrio citricus]SFN85159.1 hypothetical protein SAMN05660284_02390 [Formivibrio citricus]
MWQFLQRLWKSEPNASQSVDPEFIDQLVEIASPRIRMVSGYRDKLGPVVAHAGEAVHALEEKLPRPVVLTTENWRADPLLGIAFANPTRMAEIVSASEAVRQWFVQNPLAERAFAVLAMTREIHSRYGMEEKDGFVRQDVLQQVLVLREHRLGEPVATEGELARQARMRAMEELAHHAARRIQSLEAERALIESEINTLRIALRLGGSTDPISASAMQRQRQKRLDVLTGDLAVTRDALQAEKQLAILSGALRDPAGQLRFCETELDVDSLGVLRPGDARARRVRLVEIEMITDAPVQRVLLPVEIPRALVRTEEDRAEPSIFSVTAF